MTALRYGSFANASSLAIFKSARLFKGERA